MYYTVLQTRGPRAHSPLQLAFMHGSQATGTFWTIGQRSTLGNCIPQGTALSFGSELHSEIPCICIQRSSPGCAVQYSRTAGESLSRASRCDASSVECVAIATSRVTCICMLPQVVCVGECPGWMFVPE